MHHDHIDVVIDTCKVINLSDVPNQKHGQLNLAHESGSGMVMEMSFVNNDQYRLAVPCHQLSRVDQASTMLPCITHPPPSSTIMKPANTKSSEYSAEGTLYVSKPFRSKSAKRLRALVTFKPRKSHFDTTNESSGSNEFRVGTNLVRRWS